VAPHIAYPILPEHVCRLLIVSCGCEYLPGWTIHETHKALFIERAGVQAQVPGTRPTKGTSEAAIEDKQQVTTLQLQQLLLEGEHRKHAGLSAITCILGYEEAGRATVAR